MEKSLATTTETIQESAVEHNGQHFHDEKGANTQAAVKDKSK